MHLQFKRKEQPAMTALGATQRLHITTKHAHSDTDCAHQNQSNPQEHANPKKRIVRSICSKEQRGEQ